MVQMIEQKTRWTDDAAGETTSYKKYQNDIKQQADISEGEDSEE